jgi:acetolactate synthase-1/2/3 large subunit
MTLQELATVVQEGLAVKYVILNNQHLGMVRQWQELFYDQRYKAVPVSNPDYVKLADAYGIPAMSINHKSEVANALATAAAFDGPFVLEFKVSPDENVYPMVPPGATLAATVEDPRVLNARTEILPAPEGTVSYP